MNVKIELCMGSSCFARGNSRILSVLELFIEEKNYSDDVDIIGHLCMDNCSGGPVVKINDFEYLNRNGNEIIEIIESQLDK